MPQSVNSYFGAFEQSHHFFAKYTNISIVLEWSFSVLFYWWEKDFYFIFDIHFHFIFISPSISLSLSIFLIVCLRLFSVIAHQKNYFSSHSSSNWNFIVCSLHIFFTWHLSPFNIHSSTFLFSVSIVFLPVFSHPSHIPSVHYILFLSMSVFLIVCYIVRSIAFH